jgi:hypothetical protein
MRAERFALPAVMVALGFVFGVSRPSLAEIGDISVGGVWVCKITHDASGYSADQRAVQINKRITEVLSDPKLRRGAGVSVRSFGASATISVGDKLVFTVVPEDAMGTSVTTTELARQWARRLATGLGKALPDVEFHTF